MIKNISIGALVAVAVVLGVLTLKQPTVVTDVVYKDTPVGAIQPAPVVNIPAPIVNVAAPNVTVKAPEQKILSSVASPDLMSQWFSFGGVREWAGKLESLSTGSSTICAIQGPSATSSLDFAAVRFTLASTSAVTVDLAKGTTQYATSTKIGNTNAVGAGAQATIVASTTGSVAGDGTIFAPNQWFIVRFNELSNTSGAGNVPTGVCEARWNVI